MFNKRNVSLVIGVLIAASMILSACAQPQVQVQEVEVVKTVIVTEVVEIEGETVIETKIVEVIVTPEPEPEEGEEEEEFVAVSPEMKNPDTYMAITGAGEQETLDPSWTYETRYLRRYGMVQQGKDRRVRTYAGNRLGGQ